MELDERKKWTKNQSEANPFETENEPIWEQKLILTGKNETEIKKAYRKFQENFFKFSISQNINLFSFRNLG